ncbi:MAG: ATP-binding protein [Actinomycetota bacterium]|nr:ATP-binding protein [Actinomycetota bacterium]
MRSVDKTLSLKLPTQAASVPLARRAVCQFAAQSGADETLIDAVRLATSEALTNAVVHAYRGEPGSVYVTAAAPSGELWVLIADDGGGLEPQADRPGLGLGLALIAQVSDELAIVPRAGRGTEVRMRFDLLERKRHDQRQAATPRTVDAQPARARDSVSGCQQYA